MQIFTPERSFKMIKALDTIYGTDAIALENVIMSLADEQIEGYDGGEWHFYSDGNIGFWVPDRDTLSVSCEGNYFRNDDMDPTTYGVGVTLLALNRLVWHYHENRQDTARRLQAHYEELYAWAYHDDSTLDITALYGYLD